MTQEQIDKIESEHEGEMDEWAEIDAQIGFAILRANKNRLYEDPLAAETEIQGLQAKALNNIHRVLADMLLIMQRKQ